jgi:hypothetical protein
MVLPSAEFLSYTWLKCFLAEHICEGSEYYVTKS